MPTEGAMNARCLVLGLALAATSAASANQPLAIKVSPAVSFAPTDLIVQTRVEPDAENRSMEVVAESTDFYRSSTVELEGERAAKTTRFEFRGLPQGEYDVTVTVAGADGRRRSIAHSTVNVIESAPTR
jgi:predicted phage tail protein